MSLLKHFQTYEPFACDVTSIDNYVYVANHIDGIVIVDISNPQEPDDFTKVPVPTNCFNLFILDPYLYVSGFHSDNPENQSGLYIFNIENREEPEFITRYEQQSSYMVNVGETLFTANPWYITILNLENRTQPDTLARIGRENSLYYENSIHVANSHLFIINREHILKCFNVVDPANPQLVDTLHLETGANDLTSMGSTLLVGNSENGITTIDISNPAELTRINNFEVYSPVRHVGTVSDHFALSVHREERDDWPDSLYVFDILDNGDIDVLGSHYLQNFTGVLLYEQAGNLLFLADDYLRIVDVSDLANMVELGTTQQPIQFLSTVVIGDRYYGMLDGYIWIIDISNRDEIEILGKKPVNHRAFSDRARNALATDGTNLWIGCAGCWLYKAEVLQDAPWVTLVDSVNLYTDEDTFAPVIHVESESNTLYYSEHTENLCAIDLSTFEISQIYNTHGIISDIEHQDDLLFVTILQDSIYIFDKSDAMLPVLSSTIYHDGVGLPGSVVTVENSLYYNYLYGIRKYDISNPFDPIMIGNYTPPYIRTSIILDKVGEYVVYNNISGVDYLFVLDLTSDDPAEWQPVAWHRASIAGIWTFTVSDNLLLAENYIYQVSDELNPVKEIDEEVGLPGNITLSTSPNPFNETIQITFTLPHRTNVDIALYDLLGREIASIVQDRVFDVGKYNYSWSPSISSGIYFVRLEGNGVSINQKIIYLK
ncbi:T9SS type A sorting domain-containing protein [bacterium]|nr:T9SS type A sorting domain-containing protein [bacterium]